MSEIFLKIINMSISASYIVLAVLLLRLLLKKAPKWITVVLWGIVAVRLVCPFSIESVLSLMPSSEVVSPTIMTDKTPTINTGIPIINSTLNPVISESFTPNPGDSANPLQIWIPVLTTLWIVGMVALLIYTVISFAKVKRKIGTAVLLRDNIYQSENVVSPFVLGIIKPKIYLPFNMNEKDMEHVVAHEMAHIRRKDHLWKPLGFLLLTLHWFNPLMWLGYVLLCRDIELACDEKVIKELDHDARADYSQALLTCSVNRRMIAACPLAFGEVGVKDRVKSVLNYKKPAFWIIIAAVVACVAVAVCFLTNPPKDKAVVPHGSYMLEIYYDLDNELTEPLKQSNDVRVIIDELMDVWIFDGEQLISGGLFKETKLTDKNFDVLFEKSPIEIGVIKDLRKSIRSAWNMTYTSTENGFYPYMVIVDDESQVYLVIADHTDGKPTVISGVFKLHKLIPEKLEPVLFVDFLKNPDGMYSYVDRALSHSDFPDVSFHYTPKEIIAKTGNSETTVLSADKIWNCYFYDITGDGKADLCATVDQNKPFIARRVVVYDYQNNRKYEFADSDVNHYMLSEENGILTINRYENGDAYEEEPSSKGGLIIIENKLSLAFYTQLVGDKQITLDDVLRLSEKGAELTFEDFASYNGKDVGSGLYILSYEIDETFTLRVGGGAPIGKPMYVYLCAKSGDAEERIDIREGGVEEFIASFFAVDGEQWSDGISFVGLEPKEELLSTFEIILHAPYSTIKCTIGYARLGLKLSYGLIDSNGTEYILDVVGGTDKGTFEDIPAGTYRLLVRNSDYSGVPAYEKPTEYPDVSFDATGVLLYRVE